MPTDNPSNPPKVSVHWTPSLLSDLESVYQESGEEIGNAVRSDLIVAMGKLKLYQWDKSLIQSYGVVGDTFTFDFCRAYKFTFKVVTDRDENKQPIREHYYLKRLLLKQ